MICAGVDWSKAGWYAVALRGEMGRPRLLWHRPFSTFADLVEAVGGDGSLAVDIPIGLSDTGRREYDLLARRLLGQPRARSVFPAPPRACLAAESYNEACAASLRLTGRKLNLQTWGIMPCIREVDAVMTPALQGCVVEVHPEVCFWALGGHRAMRYSKKKPEGRAERLRVLSRHCEEQLGAALGRSSRPAGVGMDDVLDALAAALTAVAFATGRWRRIPESPATDARGLRMEMVVPG